MTEVAALDQPTVQRSNKGLRISTGITVEQFSAIGAELCRSAGALAWWIGDWARYGDLNFGARYQEIVTATGFELQTVKNYRVVAGAFEEHRRRTVVSFSHHALVAHLQPDEQDAWLDRAEENNWSKETLRLALAQQPVPGTSGSTAVRALSLRAGVDHVELWERAAEKVGKEPKEWALAVLDEAAERTLEA